MTNLTIPPRPDSLLSVIEEAAYKICRQIKRSDAEARQLCEAVVDIYDHAFFTGGRDIGNKLASYGWSLTDKEAQQLDGIYPLVEKIDFERQLEWYHQHKDTLPVFQVGAKLAEGIVLEAIEAEDDLVAAYYVQRHPEPGEPIRYVYVPFEKAQAFQE